MHAPRSLTSSSPHGNAELADAHALGIETCGRIAAFWGFTRTMGRVFGLLYLSPEPLARAQIQTRLGISVGNVSMTLAALEGWGVVHKVAARQGRGNRFSAETDFWKMIARVLNERERKEIRAAVTAANRATSQARTARRTLSGPAKQEAAFVLERLLRLRELSLLGETMLDMLLGELSLDVSRFREIFRGGGARSAERPPAPRSGARGGVVAG